MQLLNISILFLSREAFRRGCIRRQKNESFRSTIALSLLAIPTGLIVTIAFFGYSISTWQKDLIPHLLIYEHAAAIFIELLSEPLYIAASIWLDFKLRGRVDSLAMLTKSLTTVILICYTSRDPALAFADSQIVFALTVLLGYSTVLQRLMQEVRKEKTPNPLAITRKGLVGVFFVQTSEKLILAEGSKFVLMSMQNLYDEGVYGLVSNFGSIIARNVFKPLEDAAFAVFSRAKSSEDEREDARIATALSTITRGIFLVGLLSVAFGPPSSALLLQMLYSSKWSETEAPLVLAWYCPHIALMSMNGITEAFTHAVLGAKQLSQSNIFLMISAASHMAVSIYLVKLYGSLGLVVADEINMIVRICYSFWCIKHHFSNVKDFSMIEMFPSVATMISGCAAFGFLWLADRVIAASLEKFVFRFFCYGGVAIFCLAVVFFIIWHFERDVWISLRNLRQDRKTD